MLKTILRSRSPYRRIRRLSFSEGELFEHFDRGHLSSAFGLRHFVKIPPRPIVMPYRSANCGTVMLSFSNLRFLENCALIGVLCKDGAASAFFRNFYKAVFRITDQGLVQISSNKNDRSSLLCFVTGRKALELLPFRANTKFFLILFLSRKSMTIQRSQGCPLFR